MGKVIKMKVFDKLTNKWVWIGNDPDIVSSEIHHPSRESLRKAGWYGESLRTKKFSEMTEEEQKLFSYLADEEKEDKDDKV